MSLDHICSNPLENWMFNQIKKEHIIDVSSSRENIFSFESVKDYQVKLFKQLLIYVSKNSPFYKDQFKRCNINIDSICSYEDIQDIPFTFPQDIAINPYYFLCTSRKLIAREFSSSGTSGIFKKIAYSEEELVHISESIGAAMRLAGMKPNMDKLQIMYPTITGTWDPGLVMSKACDIIGCHSIINGSQNFKEQLKTIKDNNVTHFIAQASFLYSLSLSERTTIERENFDIKTIISSSEPLLEYQRKTIEEIWGCNVIRQWGTTELGLANAIECHEKDGYHTNCADFIYEVIDPITHKRVPDGVSGELVVTTLNRTCMPLIRYRTGDKTSIITTKCKCGAILDQRITDLERI